MPFIDVTLAEGSLEQLRTLITKLTDAAVRPSALPESIRVVLREVPLTHWAAGDVTIAERRAARPEPRRRARRAVMKALRRVVRFDY